MRRLWVVLSVLTLAVTFGSIGTRAGTSTVTLDLSSPITVTFTAGGSDVSIAPSSGATSGGLGVFLGAVSYSLMGGPVALTNVVSSAPFADYTAASTPITFLLNGGSLLTGSINLVNLSELGSVVSTIADLNVTGGTICTVDLICGSNVGDILLNFTLPSGFPPGFLPTTSGNTQATLLGGTGSIGKFGGLVTPEPGSLLLFGTGLLTLGQILRRRLHT